MHGCVIHDEPQRAPAQLAASAGPFVSPVRKRTTHLPLACWMTAYTVAMVHSDGGTHKAKRPSEPPDHAPAAAQPSAGNRLFASLPEASRRALGTGVQEVRFGPKDFIHRRNTPIMHAYFPTHGLISVVMPSNGKSLEIGMIGTEGMFGLPLFFGTDRCPMTAVAQVEGQALRMEAEFFRAQVRTNAPFAKVLGRYSQGFMIMLAQGLVCTHAHRMEQRCARWLLMAHDRLQTDEFRLTQESFAQMLGVRRSTVSEVAAKLLTGNLIRYSQGKMKIIDREGLEKLSCNCYRIIDRELDWVLDSRAG